MKRKKGFTIMSAKGHRIPVQYRDEIIYIMEWDAQNRKEMKKQGIITDICAEIAMEWITNAFYSVQNKDTGQMLWIKWDYLYYLKQIVHHFLHGIYPTDEERSMQEKITDLGKFLDACIIETAEEAP